MHCESADNRFGDPRSSSRLKPLAQLGSNITRAPLCGFQKAQLLGATGPAFTWSRVLGVTAVYRSWSRLFQTLPNKRGRGRWPSKGLVGLVGTERWECCFISIKKSAYSSVRTNSPVRSDPGSIPPSVNCLNCPRGCALQQAMPEQAHYFVSREVPSLAGLG